MSSATTDLTPREALARLGASTAEAIAQALEVMVPGQVDRGEVTVPPDGSNPVSSLPPGSIVASVSYVDGAVGANLFVMSLAGARALSRAMGAPPEEPEEEALSEFEMSAVAEAANQMMAAAAGAIGVVLGQEVDISPPQMQVVRDPAAAAAQFGPAPHMTATTFMIGGETCRLIQLVPSAFVARMARAMDERSAESAGRAGGVRNDDVPESQSISQALTDVRLRVWAELGRARLPLGRSLELPPGALIDLDRTADAPVDLYVNGMRFAQGDLLVTDEGEWAIRLRTMFQGVRADAEAPGRAPVRTGKD
jgi:flagellar motor switch protein FliN/FliY